MTAEQAPSSPQPPPPPVPADARTGWPRWILRMIGYLLLGPVLLVMIGWATLAVYYADLSGQKPRLITASIVAISMLAVLIFVRPRRYGLALFAVMFASVVAWFLLLKPSNDRDWLPDVANLCTARIEGDRVTLHNV